MSNSSKASDYTERKYFLVDERRFFNRAWVDRSASLVIADVLGIADTDRAAFSDRVVEAGIRSRDGRGGFDSSQPRSVTAASASIGCCTATGR